MAGQQQDRLGQVRPFRIREPGADPGKGEAYVHRQLRVRGGAELVERTHEQRGGKACVGEVGLEHVDQRRTHQEVGQPVDGR